jgi:hypothetical protein
MRNLLTILITSFFTLVYMSSFAQKQCNPNCNFTTSINISTGIDPNVGTTLSTGTIDPSWKLVNIPLLAGGATPPAAVSIPNAYVVVHNNLPNWNNIPGSGILSPNNSAGFTDNNLNTSQPWKFRRSICVCQDTEVLISGDFRADDQGTLSLYNVNSNTPVFTQGQATAPNTNNFYSNTSFSQAMILPAGNYYLEFEMINTDGTAMGFAVNGTISTYNGEITLSNGNQECCNTSFITGRKIIDNNCNGTLDTGDTAGSGWGFNLMQNNTVIATTTSDAFGDFAFNGVALGNYIVQEITQAGWIVSNPSSGQYTVNITSNSINHVSFFNCEEDIIKVNSIYCCEGESILNNGNFENGNTVFTSNYTYQPSVAANTVLPGQYTITDMVGASSISTNWFVDDHSTCNGGSGNNIMLVNGKTTQPNNTNSIIYEHTITGLDKDSTYKFCGFFKNLPQCSFDVLPEIRFQATNASYSTNWTTISQNASDPCAWQEEGFHFNPYSSTVTIRILLKEDGLGDGSDLALDDLALQLIPEPNLEITVENQSINPSQTKITASVNNLTNTDDLLADSSCEYFWVIGEANGIGGPYSNLAWGNNTSSGWGLTTIFPGYNGGFPNGTFQTGQLYVVALFVQNCECTADGFTLQYTYDMRLAENGEISLEEKETTKNQLLEFVKTNNHNIVKGGGRQNIDKSTSDVLGDDSGVNIYPNPSKGIFKILLENSDVPAAISVMDINGKKVVASYQIQTSDAALDLRSYPNGIYFVKIRQGEDIYTKRIIKIQ